MIYDLINLFSEKYFGGRYLELSGVNCKSKSLIHEEITKSLFKKKKKWGRKFLQNLRELGEDRLLSFCLLVREEIAFIVNMINAW